MCDLLRGVVDSLSDFGILEQRRRLWVPSARCDRRLTRIGVELSHGSRRAEPASSLILGWRLILRFLEGCVPESAALPLDVLDLGLLAAPIDVAVGCLLTELSAAGGAGNVNGPQGSSVVEASDLRCAGPSRW